MQFIRGSEAIRESATRKSGGGSRRFIPSINWREDQEHKYVLVVNDIEQVTKVLLHSFIPVGKGERSNGEEYTKWEEFLSRKYPAIGEDYDDLEDRLDREPKWKYIGVMVELDPIYQPGTKIPERFVVKTEQFNRNTDDGEVEVTAPVIGLCTEPAVTLWGAIESLNNTLAPVIQLPMMITRRGKSTDTRYDCVPFPSCSVDLSGVIEYLDGISYLTEEDAAAVERQIAGEDSVTGQVQVIADYILTKRLEELADKERYDELVGPLTLEDMPKRAWGKKSDKKKAGRPARRTPRQATAEAPAEAPEPAEPSRNERFAALKSRIEGT